VVCVAYLVSAFSGPAATSTPFPTTPFPTSTRAATTTPLPSNLGVTQAALLAIQDGMTLSEVERIIGKPGQLEAQSGDVSTSFWGYLAGISVVFRDGKVISKAGEGL
jgi:hypothetical protein